MHWRGEGHLYGFHLASMNLFDFRYRKDEVMWSMCCEDKNLVSVSERRESIFVESLLSGPYWVINSCGFLMMVSVFLEDFMYFKGIFAKCFYQW